MRINQACNSISGVRYEEIFAYVVNKVPDTSHAFHAGYRPTYSKQQADDGWRRATAWFKENGVG